MPLLADVGYPITVISDDTLGGAHPYNSDHDLATLTLSEYFGTDAEIDGHLYADIFDYIQQNIMDPIGIGEDQWYFPGSKSSCESPIAKGDAVSLTVG